MLDYGRALHISLPAMLWRIWNFSWVPFLSNVPLATCKEYLGDASPHLHIPKLISLAPPGLSFIKLFYCFFDFFSPVSPSVNFVVVNVVFSLQGSNPHRGRPRAPAYRPSGIFPSLPIFLLSPLPTSGKVKIPVSLRDNSFLFWILTNSGRPSFADVALWVSTFLQLTFCAPPLNGYKICSSSGPSPCYFLSSLIDSFISYPTPCFFMARPIQ